MSFITDIEGWAEKFEAFINRQTESITVTIKAAERELLRVILRDFLPVLEPNGGKLTATTVNRARLRILDEALRRFAAGDLRDAVKVLAEQLLDVAGRNASYYLLAGFDRAKVEALAKDTGLLLDILGLEANGQFTAGGYLDRLASGQEVREKVKNLVLRSLAQGITPKDLARDFQKTVAGAQGIDGALVSYFKQYAFDSYNQVREVQNLHMANELELDFFVYAGGVIDSTRAFCLKRNRKVFHREETENWKNDPDLINQKTKDSYRPLIERGRYNCRHMIMWISKDRAFELRPELREKYA